MERLAQAYAAHKTNTAADTAEAKAKKSPAGGGKRKLQQATLD